MIRRHRGIVHYTIGQRKGLNIGGQPEPLFVLGIDANRNEVILGKRSVLSSQYIKASDVNLLVSQDSPLLKENLSARIRLGHSGANCKILSLTPESIEIQFEEPQFAATPGQILVLYAGNGVVASAIIESSSL